MFEFLVRDYAIFIALFCIVASLARLFPVTLVRVWREGSRKAVLLSRGILGLHVLAGLWITVFDDWRKLLGVPSGFLQDTDTQIASDPFYVTPPSDFVRTITWILIIASVLGGAYLFARYTRSYVEPFLLGPLAVIGFFIINTFRVRLDVESVKIAYGTIETPVEIVSTLIWIAGLLVSLSFLILCFYLMLWAPIAFVISIVYRKTIGREPVVEAPIFDRLRERRNSNFQGTNSESHP